ncbi:MAG TPA: 6-phosphogluconolactonase [Opitutaceae bacterium]
MRREEEQFERVFTLVFKESQIAAAQVAAEIARLIRERGAAGKTAVLSLATGSTPLPIYRELVRMHREEGLSFCHVITFNLDEYYGLPDEHPESYYQFMREYLFRHVDIP